mmetsp:Transcript_14308/g.19569  ORF Transcript_14308/g.19569 Transcript_14308/m.19569 type:complete len:89 (+) Transcript_14308:125-391(+)
MDSSLPVPLNEPAITAIVPPAPPPPQFAPWMPLLLINVCIQHNRFDSHKDNHPTSSATLRHRRIVRYIVLNHSAVFDQPFSKDAIHNC